MRAFSLVELMVSMGVFFLLIGLALPPLASARSTARATKSESNIRQIWVLFEHYSSAYDAYPIGDEGVFYPVREDGSIESSFGHFDFGRVWPVLFRSLVDWGELQGITFSPGRRGKPTHTNPSYRYAHSFLARPRLWSGRGNADRALLRRTHPAEVRFPAAKVAMWDADLAYMREPNPLFDWYAMWADPTPMAFADGHTAMMRPGEATTPVVNPLNDENPEGWLPLNNTPDGVYGRDY